MRGLLVAFSGFGLLLGCGARPPEPKNLLLISLDSVRADFVGAYGAAELPHARGRSPTPNLDRLAAGGVLFENARSTTSWTLPAHASLLTGTPELVHGVEQDGQGLPPTLPTLAEALRRAGYRTHGVYSGPYLDPRYGFGRGFEGYERAHGQELARAADELDVVGRLIDSFDPEREPERARVALERRATAERAVDDASHRDVSSERVSDLALAELARAADDGRPFFLFAHYFDPHYDFVPPEPFARAFDPDYDGALDGRDYFTNPAVAALDASSPTGRRRVASERELEHLRALYAGEIAWTDSQVGRLLEELERRGLSANTLVVVVGDHGDEFFEHGSIGHRQTLFDEVLRVPVLLRLPGALAAGERRRTPLALCRLAHEIAGLLGLEFAAPGPLVEPVARLIRPESATLSYELDGTPMSTTGVRVRVLEGFFHDTLQILRERTLLRPTGILEPAQREAFAHQAQLTLARESLRWTDLAAREGSQPDAWSEDFSDPRAAAALRAFGASYAGLVAQRQAPLDSQDESLLAALRGLGYVGGTPPPPTVPSDELVLPPPGADRLDKHR